MRRRSAMEARRHCVRRRSSTGCGGACERFPTSRRRAASVRKNGQIARASGCGQRATGLPRDPRLRRLVFVGRYDDGPSPKPTCREAAGGEEPRKGLATSQEDATSDGEADSGAQRARTPGFARAKRRRGGARASITAARHTPREDTIKGHGRRAIQPIARRERTRRRRPAATSRRALPTRGIPSIAGPRHRDETGSEAEGRKPQERRPWRRARRPGRTLKKAEPQERIADRSHGRTRDDEGRPRSAGRRRRKTDAGQAQGGSGEPMSRYFASREDSEAEGNFTRGTAPRGRPPGAGRAR